MNCIAIQISNDGSQIFTYIADTGGDIEVSSPLILTVSDTGTFTKVLPNFYNAANFLETSSIQFYGEG